jgi:hypothetical protein
LIDGGRRLPRVLATAAIGTRLVIGRIWTPDKRLAMGQRQSRPIHLFDLHQLRTSNHR